MTEAADLDQEPAQPEASSCLGCEADDYRCTKTATCPDYENPASTSVAHVRATLDNLVAISSSTREALAALKADLEAPIPDEQFRDAWRRGLAFLTYLGVGAYVLSVLYLSAYYDRVVPGVAVSYPYVETIGAALASGGLLILLMLLSPALGFFSSALRVSRPTRELLHRLLNQIVDASVGIANAELAISELSTIVGPVEPSRPDDEEGDPCGSLLAMVDEQRQLLREQTELVTDVVSKLPLMSRTPIILARHLRLHPWVSVVTALVALIATALPFTAVQFSAGLSSLMIYWVLRLGAVILVLLMSVLYWQFATAADLVLGPRTRAARGALAIVGGAAAVVFVLIVLDLGLTAGVHDSRFPEGSLAVVKAETATGQVVRGNAVPVLGSPDVFILTVRSGNKGSTTTRVPASALRTVTTSWH